MRCTAQNLTRDETTHPGVLLEGDFPTSESPLRAALTAVQQINEIRELNEHSEVVASHRSRTSVRWIYKHELELLLARAGFARWKIDGGFHGQPLTSPEDQMVASAWVERTP